VAQVALASAGAASSAAPGTYPIVPSAAAGSGLTNYTIGYVNGTLTVRSITPTVAVTDAGGVFTGQPFPATATVAGADGTAHATLEGVAPTLSYYLGTSPAGTPLPGAPSAAGTYTVVANFPGSATYTPGSARATFSISLTANNAPACSSSTRVRTRHSA